MLCGSVTILELFKYQKDCTYSKEFVRIFVLTYCHNYHFGIKVKQNFLQFYTEFSENSKKLGT